MLLRNLHNKWLCVSLFPHGTKSINGSPIRGSNLGYLFNKQGRCVLKRIVLLFIVIFIVGCAGMPISSMYKMMTANPLEFHPDVISIAIKRSNAIQINTGDVKMNLSIHSYNPELSVSEEYFLIVDNSPHAPTLAKGVNNNEGLTILTLSPEDVIRMKSLQKVMKNHLINGGETDDFGFSVLVLKGCKNTIKIPSNVFVSLFLKLDAKSEFFPLYENFNIGQADLSPLKSLKNWDDCKN